MEIPTSEKNVTMSEPWYKNCHISPINQAVMKQSVIYLLLSDTCLFIFKEPDEAYSAHRLRITSANIIKRAIIIQKWRFHIMSSTVHACLDLNKTYQSSSLSFTLLEQRATSSHFPIFCQIRKVLQNPYTGCVQILLAFSKNFEIYEPNYSEAL